MDGEDVSEDRSAALKDSVRTKLQAGRSKIDSKKSKKLAIEKMVEAPVAVKDEIVVSDSGSDDLHNELERERRIKKKIAA